MLYIIPGPLAVVELNGYPFFMYSTAAMRDFQIDKLADEFGQYLILVECPCGHTRRCHPRTFAAMVGWDARLADVVRRLRCSKCNAKNCTARAVPLTTPRGYRSH
jgi:hypothetical protein